MSYRAILQRWAYIDQRLRHRKDYPSQNDIRAGLKTVLEEDEIPSKKTIERDIDRMRGLGAPIRYDQSRHGYYYSDLSWELPGFMLTQGELMALLVADRALAGYRNSPYYEELRGVFERLSSFLPENVTVNSEDLIANVTVITDPTTRIKEKIWNTVREGLFKNRTIAIHYQAPGYDEPSIRIVDPLHLVGHRGEWYLLCWSHDREEIRIYALYRIKRARVRKESFTRPPDFRVRDYIDPSFGVYVGEGTVQVAVRFDGEAARKIPERRWHADQQIERLETGGIIVRFRTNQQSQVLFWASQWGANAEILEPPELRERARQWFAGAAERYVRDSPG